MNSFWNLEPLVTPAHLGLYNFDLPEGSFVTGDKAYNDYTIEDVMREAGIELIPLRKKELASTQCLPI
ncbi:MAG: hypothetical protein MZV64_34945 [Ignavibacteriales bacterium]|nr:hypothetical protein [Ignavibacteriales bacterium]